MGVVILATEGIFDVSRARKRRPIDEGLIQLVLDGAPIELGELCEWIRRCNPTGLALSEGERRRRYAWKARLQSELIRRFGSELTVRDADSPGVVGLSRKSGRGDGGHAVVQELSAEAQRWVEAQAPDGGLILRAARPFAARAV
jgi:hypothetical protein